MKQITGKKRKKQTRKVVSRKDKTSGEEVTLTSPEEFQELKNISAMAVNTRLVVGACWLKLADGTEKCLQLPIDVCKSRGGVWLSGACVDYPLK